MDDRITFLQLSDTWLHNKIYADVWYPRYSLETSMFEDELKYSESGNVIVKLYSERLKPGSIEIYKSRESK